MVELLEVMVMPYLRFKQFFQTFLLRATLFGTNRQVDGPNIFAGAKDLLQEDFSKKTGGAGDEDVLARIKRGYVAVLSHGLRSD